MSALAPCPDCRRHVRVGAQACPICCARLDEALRAIAPPRAPRDRLGRSALYAFGIGTIAIATSACDRHLAGSGPSGEVYGGPPHDAPTADAAAGNDGASKPPAPPSHDMNMVPAYGAPPPSHPAPPAPPAPTKEKK